MYESRNWSHRYPYNTKEWQLKYHATWRNIKNLIVEGKNKEPILEIIYRLAPKKVRLHFHG